MSCTQKALPLRQQVPHYDALVLRSICALILVGAFHLCVVPPLNDEALQIADSRDAYEAILIMFGCFPRLVAYSHAGSSDAQTAQQLYIDVLIAEVELMACAHRVLQKSSRG